MKNPILGELIQNNLGEKRKEKKKLFPMHL